MCLIGKSLANRNFAPIPCWCNACSEAPSNSPSARLAWGAECVANMPSDPQWGRRITMYLSRRCKTAAGSSLDVGYSQLDVQRRSSWRCRGYPVDIHGMKGSFTKLILHGLIPLTCSLCNRPNVIADDSRRFLLLELSKQTGDYKAPNGCHGLALLSGRFYPGICQRPNVDHFKTLNLNTHAKCCWTERNAGENFAISSIFQFVAWLSEKNQNWNANW